jgi:hypothetical protein
VPVRQFVPIPDELTEPVSIEHIRRDVLTNADILGMYDQAVTALHLANSQLRKIRALSNEGTGQ